MAKTWRCISGLLYVAASRLLNVCIVYHSITNAIIARLGLYQESKQITCLIDLPTALKGLYQRSKRIGNVSHVSSCSLHGRSNSQTKFLGTTNPNTVTELHTVIICGNLVAATEVYMVYMPTNT